MHVCTHRNNHLLIYMHVGSLHATLWRTTRMNSSVVGREQTHLVAGLTLERTERARGHAPP